MLPFQLTLLKATTVSALSLQLVRPMLPAESNSTANFALPNGLQAAANASPLLTSSNNIPHQWDGTIALPPEGLTRSLSSTSSSDPSQLWNDTYISAFNTSAGPRPRPGPRPAPDLPPLPRGWGIACTGRYGIGMNPSSCLEAWSLLPPIERTLSFGPRNAANTYDVGLPKRYLSCMLQYPPMPLVPY